MITITTRLWRWTCIGSWLVAGHALAQSGSALPSPSTLRSLGLEDLMRVEVTSVSRRPEPLGEAASSVQIITADDVRRSGATNLPEALRFASNLEVAQIDSRQWAISARGFNNVFADKMLVLVDGRTVYTPLYAGVYWDAQDTVLEDLDRIEVISGPGATQWGANAVNGVISVTTKNAKDTQGSLVSFGTGTPLRYSAAVRTGNQAAPGVYYRVYAKAFDHGDSRRSNGTRSEDAWRMGQVGFRVDSERSHDALLTLQGDAYDTYEGQAGPDAIRTNGANFISRWSKSLSPEADLKIQFYYDRTHRRIPDSFKQNIDTFDLDLQQNREIANRIQLVWGLGYRVVEDAIVNTPQNAFLPPRVHRDWFNGFFQSGMRLADDHLYLTLGSKLEHEEYTGFQIEPSARLSWVPDRTVTLWAALSRAVRGPSRVDRDLYSPATPPYRVAGSPDVLPEKLHALDLGYRAQLRPSLSLAVAAFYNLYDDLRSLEPLSPPQAFPVESSNGLRGHSYGAEVNADYFATAQWHLRGGFTELRVSSEPQPGMRGRGIRGSIADDPNHQFQLRSLLDLPAHWEWDTSLRYVSAIGNQRVPAYAELDVRFGWHPLDGLELSFGGQNLLHAHHAEFNRPGSRREIPRGFFNKVSWRF